MVILMFLYFVIGSIECLSIIFIFVFDYIYILIDKNGIWVRWYAFNVF